MKIKFEYTNNVVYGYENVLLTMTVVDSEIGMADYVATFAKACKSYGKTVVLKDLHMNVPEGTIFGLLGPSGCGKTTLLTCLIGRRNLDSGQVLCFGEVPGTRVSGVPGPRVGYMPQDTALVPELTISETVYYFGWIYGMDNQEIEKRFNYLEDLLQLPPRTRRVKNLSGGEQRRTSLAATLIHNAELLILDEPTVGLDPVLRQKIWDYFVEISAKQRQTIIITTHYVEEARQAHNIALMRRGKLLCQGPPDSILQSYNTDNIQHVFSVLSTMQESETVIVTTDRATNNGQYELKFNPLTPDHRPTNENENVSKPKSTYYSRQKALISKNVLRIFRDRSGFAFTFFLPIMLTVIFFYALVRDPTSEYHVGVVNQDSVSCDNLNEIAPNVTITDDGLSICKYQDLSCYFLYKLNNNTRFKFHYHFFDELDSAIQHGKKGKVVAIMHFAENFSASAAERYWRGINVEESSLSASDIHVRLDHTDSLSAIILQKIIYENYFNYAHDIIGQCGENPKLADVPIHFGEPVFGQMFLPLGEDFLPGSVSGLIFFLGTSAVTLILTIERTEGIWERSRASGVSTNEILASHWIVQSGVVFLQTQILYFLGTEVFNLNFSGGYIPVSGLIFIQGLCGVSLGFAISASFDDIILAGITAVGSYVPTLLTNGTTWPLEAMPTLLYWSSYYLPTTIGSRKLREIAVKGWPFFSWQVIGGYVELIVWIGILMTYTCIVLRIKE